MPILRHTKTPSQWRTDTPRKRTKKVSNVPSEILLKIAFCQFCEPFPVVLPPVPILKIVFCQFCQPFPVVLPPVLKTALRHTKTPWQWRTDTPRNRTKKVSNVPSEILLKIAFCQFCEPFPVVLPPVPILKIVFSQFCQPFPVVLPPVLKTALRHTKTPWQWRTDTPRNRTKKLSNVPSETLLKIVFCQYSATPKHHGSEGRTRHEIAPKKCLTSLLKSY